MSYPFIIWTMRRTGGTSLAGLLGNLSEYPKISHEPFNRDRIFGDITNTWNSDRSTTRLSCDIRKALANRPVIKHCYELCPPELNDCLMKVSIDLGYRHIILDRRAEDDRVLSLELALATDAWGGHAAKTIYGEIIAGIRRPRPIDFKRAVTHINHCLSARRKLLEILHRYGQTPFVVYFEDIYLDPTIGRDLLRRVVEFVGLNRADFSDYEEMEDKALLTQGQNSVQILQFVPGALELREILQNQLRHRPTYFVAS